MGEKNYLHREAEFEASRKKPSILRYLVLLFSAALLLLVMAYFMQQRASEVAISGLTETISTMQTVQSLADENAELHDDVDALRAEIAELNRTIAAQTAALRECEETIAALRGEVETLRAARAEETETP